MNKFHAQSKIFLVTFIFFVSVTGAKAQSGWVVNTSPSPWGAYYGLPAPAFPISSGSLPNSVFYNYDANGNRVLRYVYIDLRKAADIKGDEEIGIVAKEYVEDIPIDAIAPKVFPNPTTENIYVQQDGSIKDGNLELYDSKGQLVKQQQIKNSNTIEIADLPQGFYLLVLRSGKTTLQWKINKI